MFNQRKDLVPIARVVKSNGADGEMVFSMKDLDSEELNDKEPVFFIRFDESPVPFFIESLSPRGGRKALVRLQGVRSGEDVGEIIGKEVYVEASSLPNAEDEEDGAFLIGWTLYDCSDASSDETDKSPAKRTRKKKISVTDCRKIGEITDFIDIPNNPCIEVDTKNGAVMLPLHEDLIVSIDEDSQSIVMSIPTGLI